MNVELYRYIKKYYIAYHFFNIRFQKCKGLIKGKKFLMLVNWTNFKEATLLPRKV